MSELDAEHGISSASRSPSRVSGRESNQRDERPLLHPVLDIARRAALHYSEVTYQDANCTIRRLHYSLNENADRAAAAGDFAPSQFYFCSSSGASL